MKLSEQLTEFYEHSSKVSELVRGINYSLIAFVWILSHEETDELMNYKCVLLGILISLLFDFIHYLWLTITTGITYNYNEKKYENRDHEVSYPNYIKVGSWILFILKIATMISSVTILVYNII